MDRKYWIVLGLGILVILYLRSRVAAESSKEAVNTMLIKSNTPAGGTGYYHAADLGYDSPYGAGAGTNAAGTSLAGSTLVIDITPHSAANNLPYDRNQSEIVV